MINWEVNMSIGENIKRIRRDKGLTQGELAQKSKLGLNLISRLERDATDPKLSSIYKLINALGCTADALLLDNDISGLPMVLKTSIERISSLGEDDQKAIIHVIDNYTNAVAYSRMLEGKAFLGIRNMTGKTENVLK
jgi:transcriptional regulator with XRE-family HTH domain